MADPEHTVTLLHSKFQTVRDQSFPMRHSISNPIPEDAMHLQIAKQKSSKDSGAVYRSE